MATTILFVASASLLLRAVITLPISQDLISVLKVENTRDGKTTNVPVLLNFDPILSLGDTEQVKILDSVTFDRALKRIKRQVITGNHNCAEGMVWFWNRCVSLEKYKELTENGDYDEN